MSRSSPARSGSSDADCVDRDALHEVLAGPCRHRGTRRDPSRRGVPDVVEHERVDVDVDRASDALEDLRQEEPVHRGCRDVLEEAPAVVDSVAREEGEPDRRVGGRQSSSILHPYASRQDGHAQRSGGVADDGLDRDRQLVEQVVVGCQGDVDRRPAHCTAWAVGAARRPDPGGGPRGPRPFAGGARARLLRVVDLSASTSEAQKLAHAARTSVRRLPRRNVLRDRASVTDSSIRPRQLGFGSQALRRCTGPSSRASPCLPPWASPRAYPGSCREQAVPTLAS